MVLARRSKDPSSFFFIVCNTKTQDYKIIKYLKLIQFRFNKTHVRI